MRDRTVLTIGNFDGVHAGHRELFARARHFAERGTDRAHVVALVFDPHPLTILRPSAGPARLTTFEERARLLRDAGADEVIRLTPSAELLALTPDAFLNDLIHRYRPAAIVEGEDFRFGHARAGDIAYLAQTGRERSFETIVVPPVSVALSDQSIVTASSSFVRWLVDHARVEDAERVLLRPYELVGTVVKGDQRGRAIGFPTANLSTECLLPRDAVYAGEAELSGGRVFPAAIHVGTRATFNDHLRTCEAYILDWPGPIAEGTREYGWTLRLRFHRYLRDQARFETVDQLVDQIRLDVRRTRAAAPPQPRTSGIIPATESVA